ncbi:hypothetical protein DLD77_02325 [Chitinophaga alhagiae]|uniref:Uncharacterized protein n=1 Tax=Chitinophaga alhagiae TaxID=2203219 RepID=A0ABM6W9Q9_9BACT|nr:hypothetical protein DLD77_02325 [Chitinophaga alhagiae]
MFPPFKVKYFKGGKDTEIFPFPQFYLSQTKPVSQLFIYIINHYAAGAAFALQAGPCAFGSTIFFNFPV